MKFKVPAPIMNKVGRQVLLMQKNSPALLVAAGTIGVVTTTVLACRATLKVDEVIDQKERDFAKIKAINVEEYSEQDRIKDLAVVHTRTVVSIAKLYTPAVVAGVATVGCFVGSHRILSTRNAGLMAAYATLERGFSEYRARVVEEFGEGNDRTFRYGKEVEVITNEDGTTTRTVQGTADGKPSIYARFFDQFSKNYSKTPTYNQMFLRAQQNYANDLLRARGHVFLNEVYDMLGLERTKEGAVVGWIYGGEGDDYIDFGVFDGDVYSAMRFVNGDENSVLLDFNVDGVIYDKI